MKYERYIMIALLAAVWAVRLSQCATIRGSAFLAANLLTGAFNLLPIPPLDGAQMAQSLWTLHNTKNRNCISGRNRVQ